MESFLKQISQIEMGKLLKHGYVVNTKRGYVTKTGQQVGFYRTKNKRYIEDRYVNLAKDLD